jgi:hypothetical protein
MVDGLSATEDTSGTVRFPIAFLTAAGYIIVDVVSRIVSLDEID